MQGSAFPSRMAIAAQLSEQKPFRLDENGREEIWTSLGGIVVNWPGPLGDARRFDKHNRCDTLYGSQSARLIIIGAERNGGLCDRWVHLSMV